MAGLLPATSDGSTVAKPKNDIIADDDGAKPKDPNIVDDDGAGFADVDLLEADYAAGTDAKYIMVADATKLHIWHTFLVGKFQEDCTSDFDMYRRMRSVFCIHSDDIITEVGLDIIYQERLNALTQLQTRMETSGQADANSDNEDVREQAAKLTLVKNMLARAYTCMSVLANMRRMATGTPPLYP